MIEYLNGHSGSLIRENHITKGTWINIAPPFNLEELERLAAELEIPLDFLTDSLDIDERSRYELENVSDSIYNISHIIKSESVLRNCKS